MESGFPPIIGFPWSWRFGDRPSLLHHRDIAHSEWRKLFLAKGLTKILTTFHSRENLLEHPRGFDAREALIQTLELEAQPLMFKA